MYNVIIVDDENLMRETLRNIIENIDGFKVVYECKNGLEAVEYTEKNPVDIIFMDVMMPIMDGLEASKRILQKHTNISIYIVSAYHNYNIIKKALNYRVKEYMFKPIIKEDIITVLKRFKKHSSTNMELIFKDIMNSLKNNDFMSVYYNLERFSKLIKETDFDNENKIIDELYILGNRVLNLYPKEIDNLNIEKDISLKEIFVKDQSLYSTWLFKVVSTVFENKAIINYEILKNVFKFINENTNKNISLKDIVTQCSISQGYLSRIFKKEMNVTVTNYIHLKKINIAKEQFGFKNISISDVVNYLDYNDTSYFCKLFKKYEGITVEQYREKLY